MNGPTFAPGMECWHVRHGKVSIPLKPCNHLHIPSTLTHPALHLDWDGKEQSGDVGRVLYTLSEAKSYGWLKEDAMDIETRREKLRQAQSELSRDTAFFESLKTTGAYKEPCTVEFEETIEPYMKNPELGDLRFTRALFKPFIGKRVHVTVRECGE